MCAYLGPDEKSEDPYKWYAVLRGPEGSPYAGGTFKVTIEIPEGYPKEPPKVEFDTKVYHPNISMNGEVCLDILDPMEWNKCLTLEKVS